MRILFASVLVTGLLLAGFHSLADAAPYVILEQPVHFVGSDGSDVVAEAGIYQVEVSASQSRLIAEGRTPLLLPANRRPTM